MWWVLTFFPHLLQQGWIFLFWFASVFVCFCWRVFFFLLLSLFWKENNVQLLPPSLKNKFYLRTSWGMRNCMVCLWQPSQGRRENQMRGKGKWFYSVDTIRSITGYLVNSAIKYNHHFTDEETDAQHKERRSWQFQSIKNPPKVNNNKVTAGSRHIAYWVHIAYCILSAALSTASSFRICNSSTGILSLPGASVRNSAHDKGHEEGGSAYAKTGSSLRSPPGNSRASTPKTRVCLLSALCFHLYLWLYRGLSPTTSLWKKS